MGEFWIFETKSNHLAAIIWLMVEVEISAVTSCIELREDVTDELPAYGQVSRKAGG